MKNPHIPIRKISAIFSLSLAFAGAAPANVIYQDDFSGNGSNQLNGTTPDITIGANAWIADDAWLANGAVSGYGTALLPFSPTSNNVYTLSATLNNTTSTNWLTIGFVDSLSSPNVLFNLVAIGLSLDPGGSLIVRTPGAFNQYSGVSGQTAEVVLDTTGVLWQVRFSYGGTPIQTYDFESNPTIAGVAMGSQFSDGNVGNFTLADAVPEPATAGLLVLSAAGIALRRVRPRTEAAWRM